MKTPEELWKSKKDPEVLLKAMLDIIEKQLDVAPVFPGLEYLSENTKASRFIDLDLRADDFNFGHLPFETQKKLFQKAQQQLGYLGYEASVSIDKHNGKERLTLKIYTQEK